MVLVRRARRWVRFTSFFTADVVRHLICGANNEGRFAPNSQHVAFLKYYRIPTTATTLQNAHNNNHHNWATTLFLSRQAEKRTTVSVEPLAITPITGFRDFAMQAPKSRHSARKSVSTRQSARALGQFPPLMCALHTKCVAKPGKIQLSASQRCRAAPGYHLNRTIAQLDEVPLTLLRRYVLDLSSALAQGANGAVPLPKSRALRSVARPPGCRFA